MAERGFSLIELLVSVTVVGILASIAYPTYQNYVVEGRRSQAQQFLMDLAQRQERLRLDRGSYSIDPALFPLPGVVAAYYGGLAIDPAGGAPNCFVASLTPINGTSQENDGRLVMSSRGETCRQTADPCTVDQNTCAVGGGKTWDKR